VSAIAATSTTNFAEANAVSASSGAALAHGFQTGLYVLTGLLLVGALVAFGLVRSHAPQPVAAPVEDKAEAGDRERRRSRPEPARLARRA
jgi:hypothetical protein